MNFYLRFHDVMRRGLAAFAALVAISPAFVNAAPGDFDPTFGSGIGKVLQPIGALYDEARGLTALPGGQWLVHGVCSIELPAGPNSYCLARFNADGSLDASYGNSGIVLGTLNAFGRKSESVSRSLVRLPDGKVVIAMSCNTGSSTPNLLCLVRHHPDGSRDTSFGTNGLGLLSFGGVSQYVVDSVAQTDGKIVVAVFCESTAATPLYYACIARFNADGSVDNDYGDGGIKISQFGLWPQPIAIALDAQGRALLGIRCRDSQAAPWRFCVFRYTTAGQLDITFATNGRFAAQPGFGNDSSVRALLVQRDSKIVIAGRCKASALAFNEFCMMRLLPNGAVDNDIGAAGLLWNSGLARGSEVTAASVLPNGQYLFAGTCYPNSSNFEGDFCMMRVNENGSLDSTFGVSGVKRAVIGTASDRLTGIGITATGQYLLSGDCETGSTYAFCLAQFDGGPTTYRACSLDLDGDGRYTATIDGIIAQRIMNGIVGNAAVAGLSFPNGATRTNWAGIRHFLITQCAMSLPQ